VTDISEVPDINPTESGQVGEVDGEAPNDGGVDLNIDDFANHYVTVKVDGEEIKVPLSEAVAGYSRQADYTRKTQELAQQRQELQWANAIREALDSNPAQTIDLLAQHYGISRQEAQTMADEFDWGSTESDPIESKMTDLDKRIRAFEEQQAYDQLERTVQTLQSKYGEDFDANEVIAAALARGTNDLESTYKQIAYDRLVAKAEATKKVAADKAAKEEAVVESKRSASAVSGGSSAKGGGDEVGAIRSISDAWAAAKRQYNIT
jgi:hypothetical protein